MTLGERLQLALEEPGEAVAIDRRGGGHGRQCDGRWVSSPIPPAGLGGSGQGDRRGSERAH
jgi:hypothetical protein